jgi:hypothetical protein
MIALDIRETAINTRFEFIKQKIIADANKQLKSKVLKIFNDLVRVTPQWSGNYASNWYITQDYNSSKYTENINKGKTTREDASVRGDMFNIRSTINAANGVRLDFTKPVYLMNNTPVIFDENTNQVLGYDQPFEGATWGPMQKVRSENLVNGRIASVSYIMAKYR